MYQKITDARRHNRDLQTSARTSYDAETHTGLVELTQRLFATDFSGTIRFFRRIDPAVTRIDVLAEGVPDVAYLIDERGEWVCRRFLSE